MKCNAFILLVPSLPLSMPMATFIHFFHALWTLYLRFVAFLVNPHQEGLPTVAPGTPQSSTSAGTQDVNIREC
jgi:hypothetical protein